MNDNLSLAKLRTPTRSVSEAAARRPRLRFGLVKVAAAFLEVKR